MEEMKQTPDMISDEDIKFDDYFKGTGQEPLPLTKMIVYTENTPEQLRGYVPNEKVVLSTYVINKIMAREQSKLVRHPHCLTQDDLIAVRHAIEHPVAIIKSDERIVILTDALDYANNPIIAVLGNDAEHGRNYISTMYGRSNIMLYLSNQQSRGNLAYLDTDRILNATSKILLAKTKTMEDTKSNSDHLSDLMDAALNIVKNYRDQKDRESRVDADDMEKYNDCDVDAFYEELSALMKWHAKGYGKPKEYIPNFNPEASRTRGRAERRKQKERHKDRDYYE